MYVCLKNEHLKFNGFPQEFVFIIVSLLKQQVHSVFNEIKTCLDDKV